MIILVVVCTAADTSDSCTAVQLLRINGSPIASTAGGRGQRGKQMENVRGNSEVHFAENAAEAPNERRTPPLQTCL